MSTISQPTATTLPVYDAFTSELTPPEELEADPLFPEFDTLEAEQSSDLPAYHARTRSVAVRNASPAAVEHVYYATNNRDRRWLTLKVRSSASSPTSLPGYYEGQPISGCVELDLDKVDTIQSVVINVIGKAAFSRFDPAKFYNSSLTLWNTSMGDPSRPSNSGHAKHDGKLQGQYTWPFSITLQKYVNVDINQLKDLGLHSSQTLPPSFTDTAGYAQINYELSVVIKRSGVFSPDGTVCTNFRYTPRSRSAPPSLLRQLAYKERIPLLGPEIDPAGWTVFPPVHIEGTLFHVLKVSIHCSLALATPLSYSRGSVIPCMLILESNDAQALDLLSNPSNPVVELHRKIIHKIGVDDVGAKLAYTIRNARVSLSTARWWPPEDKSTVDLGAGAVSYKRTLVGEINLPRKLEPSFTFGSFAVKYHVGIYPFEAAGFVPTKEGRLLGTEVTITTDHARGPPPRAYLPPDYDGQPSSKKAGTLKVSKVLKQSGFI